MSADPAARRAVVRRALSVGLAPAVYGVSLGALGVASGLSILQTCVTSLLLFSGGSQFALIGVLGGGGSAASAITTSSLLGIRNGLYGLQMAPVLRPRGVRRILAAHLTIDESTAVAVSQREPAHQRLGFWITGGAIFLVWNLTTLLGALAGDAIGDPRRYGLDAAAAGAFLGLLWPRLRAREPVAVAVAAAVLAAVLVPVLPVGLPVVAAAGVAVAAGLRRT
jgi:predicted branched-subunit amino acid permease